MPTYRAGRRKGCHRNETDALHTLRLTAARWHAILDTAQDAIICITQHGEVTLFNAAIGRNVLRKMDVESAVQSARAIAGVRSDLPRVRRGTTHRRRRS